MFKSTFHVHEFTTQREPLTSVPADDYQEPAVDDPHSPTRISVYASDRTAAALRTAQRHLTLLHARRAYTEPGSVTRTAADVVYAEARHRAETLMPNQRHEESLCAIHSEDDALRMDALTDVMHGHGELPF
ncbi:hypothetical protein [Streptomyces lydicus]|uniref:hypothetical protein n=1 Tax=Streptomyces lydicus TaxID=47763 RepID=UPI001012063E|nr:hypothetical protein [Streptomyces lydicus]MCZ1012041.1 hypothetical protein [Streptomyces lydicus]